ncbi:MAG: alcohol dehydrogenase family protein [Halofilum sp. (in: g-proteobacteria)]|nr:alcohol dehydrogenase family protein [Halofilum sp. (in: g-proteobacteria)]
MPSTIPDTMAAVLLTGHGGMDKLEYREDVPVPRPGPGEVLIRVAAAGVNNTDINTRIGWYSKNVTGDTSSGAAGGYQEADTDDASWGGKPLEFPRIQGADCCGRIVAVGDGVDEGRIGERVIVRGCLLGYSGGRPFESQWLGSEKDGGFAQYTTAPAVDTFAIDCDWSDAELGAVPCSYSTAEGLLHRSGVGADDRVLVTGASGGVGSSAVQLARARGAEVVAVAGASKADWVREHGAGRVIDRDADPVEALGEESVSVVIDLVGGSGWPRLLEVLRRGGRYATSGAIAGPIVELDLRTLYLKDLSLFGSTHQDDGVFQGLIQHIEQGRIRPVVSQTYPLRDIVQAQEDFLAKRHTGKLVLIPPQDD